MVVFQVSLFVPFPIEVLSFVVFADSKEVSFIVVLVENASPLAAFFLTTHLLVATQVGLLAHSIGAPRGALW